LSLLSSSKYLLQTLPDATLATKMEIESAVVYRIQIAQRHGTIAIVLETHKQIDHRSRKALKGDGSVVRLRVVLLNVIVRQFQEEERNNLV
jgi:hypothetical protein